jgi:polyisoprenoid-binding protein YceI
MLKMETLSLKKTKWVLDPAHSELNFKVKHLMIANVKGEFRKWEAETDGEDLVTSSVFVKIDASSVFTNDDTRDTHLKSADFFDVENHKEITFKSTSFKKTDNEKYKLTGQLTIRGVSKNVTLDVEFGGTNKDPWGNEKAAYSLNGVINRKDWGLNWNAALETGGVLVSDEVRISGDIQFVKKTIE